jgi:hypothetical protein
VTFEWLPPEFEGPLKWGEVLHYLGVIAASPEPTCDVHVDFQEEGPKREDDPWWPRCHGRIDGRLSAVRDYSDKKITVPGHLFPVGDDGYFVLYEERFTSAGLSTIDGACYYALSVTMGTATVVVSDAYNGR